MRRVLYASLTALLTVLTETARQATKDRADAPVHRRWMMPGVVIGLTLLNYVMNNIDGAQRNTQLMEKLDRLLLAGAAAEKR